MYYFTAKDYLTFAIKWLTPIAFGFFIYFFIELFTKRVERGLSEEELVALSKNPKFTKKFQDLSSKFMRISFGIMLIIKMLMIFYTWSHSGSKIDVYNDLTVTLTLGWLLFACWYIEIPRLTQNWNKQIACIFIFGPLILLYAYFSGLKDGESTKYDKFKFPIVEIIQSDTDKPLKGKVIFLLDKYYIFTESNSKHLLVYPTSNIKSIKALFNK